MLVLPLSLAIGTIVSNAGEIVDWAASLRSFTIPDPPAWLGTLPVVGPQAVEAWQTFDLRREKQRQSFATKGQIQNGTFTIGPFPLTIPMVWRHVPLVSPEEMRFLPGETCAEEILLLAGKSA